ncbi:MAG: Sec-dependent nitrous-oxide reductase [Gemmatimonadota bacterium]
MRTNRKLTLGLAGIGAALLGVVGLDSCSSPGAGADVGAVAQARGLSEQDVLAAVKTYQPSGKLDEYIMFGSGGHSGQALVIGVPSMRLLKVIGVFTPEPWQGYGYGAEETQRVLDEGRMEGRDLKWGDTHHPALSETDGDYDGQFLFINDKANPRIAVIDLADFETKQIVPDPNMGTNHGGTFVTPNTEYVIEAAQYSVPLWEKYADVDDYAEAYRGLVTFYRFDRDAGRIDVARSFSMELPPYWHDLSDAGKGPSFGWAFLNSFNTELATGGVEDGNPPFEAGASANDMDYMHVIDWVKAAEVADQPGKTRTRNGIRIIPIQTAVEEGLLYLVPEPKSPHGVDVTPDGSRLVVSGKLDQHATTYSWAKIKSAIDEGRFDGTDAYGIPVIAFEDAMESQLELGLGPLHTQFDNAGNAYTSLFLESKVAKWRVNPPELLEKIDVHYNVGHIATAEGDTKSPDGKYLVSLNKWSIDRFNPVGPLHPQNFQLIDLESSPMQMLYDMPVGIGEPHYAQIIKADKLNPDLIYPAIGFDPGSMQPDPNATKAGEERIERVGDTVHVYMTAVRSHFTPEYIRVREGDDVMIHITNVEQTRDATHGFGIAKYDINLSLEPGESQVVHFKADRAGVFPFYCTEFCSALHLEMTGYLLVEPRA